MFNNHFDISLLLNRYVLFGLAFWSREHCRGAVLVNEVWHHYDGLSERSSLRAGTEKMHREAVHFKWLPPSSLTVCICIFEKILH